MTIDTHHHFWNYTSPEFDWVGDPRLKRDFLPEELSATLEPARVDAVISVQSRQSDEETRWLLQLADKYSFIAGVVGWLPLIESNVQEQLARFAQHPKACGVRHVLQGESDDAYMLREDFQRGLAALSPLDLAYDLLILPRHLPHAIELVDRHPRQVFVLDHLAKPLEGNDRQRWESDLHSLAERENVYCKISAGIIEIDPTQTRMEVLRPLFDTAIEAFGADRLMFGSNWPLTEVAGGYDHWINLVREWARSLSQGEQDSLMGGTATDAYRLGKQK